MTQSDDRRHHQTSRSARDRNLTARKAAILILGGVAGFLIAIRTNAAARREQRRRQYVDGWIQGWQGRSRDHFPSSR